jgi:uncharacterized protein YjbI with pentapeptide repeats
MCEYEFRNGERCKEEALPNSKYCILHVDLPEDVRSDEFKRINELKEEKVKEKVNKGDFNFEGAKLFEIDFSKMEIECNVDFDDVVIIKKVSFYGAKIGGDVSFHKAKGRSASFDKAEIGGDVSFKGAEIVGDLWFEGAEIVGDVRFEGAVIRGYAWFSDANIGGHANFDGAKISLEVSFGKAKIGTKEAKAFGWASFCEAEIGDIAWFKGAEITGNASFEGAKIEEDAMFEGAKIGGGAGFEGAEIGRDVLFDKAEIVGSAWFEGAKIGRDTSFEGAKISRDAWFEGAKIGRDVWFDLLEIKGTLSFKDAKFEKNEAQEESCRKAKRTWENVGNRIEVDYYFYREMEAKRKQKYLIFSLKELILKLMVKLGLEKLIDKYKEFFERILKLIHKLGLEKRIEEHKEIFEKERRIYWGFLELPVQYIFGYGVYPWKVIATWLLTVIALAFVYWKGNGVLVGNELEVAKSFWECLYFSVVTAATPGYGGYHPKPGFYQGLASFEAVFGTFMWAAFIATFARKYMR